MRTGRTFKVSQGHEHPGGADIIDQDLLETKFARIGARLKLADRVVPRWREPAAAFSLDVRADRGGEFFEVASRPDALAGLNVLDVRPGDRHLLLMVRGDEGKSKYLCGHDERHWFVAAVPESAPVGTVRAAMDALKPPEVRAALALKRVGAEAGNRRKNDAFRRQGEWFFLPAPGVKPDARLVLRDEPIRRGNGGKPHRVDFCYRTGGEAVYVCNQYPNGVNEDEYRAILAENPRAKVFGWRVMRRNPIVYVRGRVRHADHKTITLHNWHRVLMNTETQARAMRNVAFLD